MADASAGLTTAILCIILQQHWGIQPFDWRPTTISQGVVSAAPHWQMWRTKIERWWQLNRGEMWLFAVRKYLKYLTVQLFICCHWRFPRLFTFTFPRVKPFELLLPFCQFIDVCFTSLCVIKFQKSWFNLRLRINKILNLFSKFYCVLCILFGWTNGVSSWMKLYRE